MPRAQDSVLGTQRACNPESILAAQPTAVRAGEAATAHAIDATHGVAADCRALHRCSCRDDGEGSHAAMRAVADGCTVHTGSSRVTAGQMNARTVVSSVRVGSTMSSIRL